MISGSWVYHSDGWYYLDKSGEMHTGWLQIDDNWYYLEESGKSAKGMHEIGGKLYCFLTDSNKMVCNDWYQYNGDWYYFSSTGAAYQGQWVQNSDGKFYYFGADGKMVKNAWIKSTVLNKYYWVNENGEYIEERDTENPDGKVVVQVHHPENPKHYRRSNLEKFFRSVPVIKAEDSKDFVRRFNENIVSDEFLETCRKAGKLFGRKK